MKASLLWEEILKEVYFRGIKAKGEAELTLEVSAIQQTTASAPLLTPCTGFHKSHAFQKRDTAAYDSLGLSLVTGCK